MIIVKYYGFDNEIKEPQDKGILSLNRGELDYYGQTYDEQIRLSNRSCGFYAEKARICN